MQTQLDSKLCSLPFKPALAIGMPALHWEVRPWWMKQTKIGLDEHQIVCLAELEIKRQQASVTGPAENEFCREVRMAAAKTRIRSDYKIKKKGKSVH